MEQKLKHAGGETAAHLRLKRRALVWAQARGYSACALEVNLPRCRYRADIAAYRAAANAIEATAIFECKQALADLRSDNCSAVTARTRLAAVHHRRSVLEKNLRVHYPSLRIADTLFPEFDSHDFALIPHRGYARVRRELNALQNRLIHCTKFDKLIHYRCANLFYLVLPDTLIRESELPIGWGVLVESSGELLLLRKPVWCDTTSEDRLRFLQRIAAAGTRVVNRQLEITFDEVIAARRRSDLTPA